MRRAYKQNQVIFNNVYVSGINFASHTTPAYTIDDSWNPGAYIKFTNDNATLIGADAADGPLFAVPPKVQFQISYDNNFWFDWAYPFQAAMSGNQTKSYGSKRLPEAVPYFRVVVSSGGLYGSTLRMELMETGSV